MLTCLVIMGCSSTSDNGEVLEDNSSAASLLENGQQFIGDDPVYQLTRLLAADTTELIDSLNQQISSGSTLSEASTLCLNDFDVALGQPLLEFDSDSDHRGKLVPSEYCLEQASNAAAQNCAIESASLVLPLAWIVPEQNDENSVRPIPLLGATISYAGNRLTVSTPEQVGNPASTCEFNLANNAELASGEAVNCAQRVVELRDRLQEG